MSAVFSPFLPAKGTYLPPQGSVREAIQALGFQQPQPTLVVIGGANHLDDETRDRVQRLFSSVLAPVAEKWGACVVDGGTDSGVIHLMGEARLSIGGTFPLVGVAPDGLVILPKIQHPEVQNAEFLEPNHTHFFLVPGDEWGDESGWLAEIATQISGNAPSVTVLINGGEITWKDALANVEHGRTLIVIEGSGRTADKIAAVFHGEVGDPRADELLKSGLIKFVCLDSGISDLYCMIESIFQKGIDTDERRTL
jgi:hypothetical protein